MTLSTSFETETCGRCGGSGRYSFNQISGSVCFGCNGGKKKLTKRGHAARAKFLELVSKPAGQVQVDDQIKSDVNGKWFKVVGAKDLGRECVYIQDGVEHRSRLISLDYGKVDHHMSDSTIVRAVRSVEERLAALQTAYAYQDTLGKTGKPLKVAA